MARMIDQPAGSGALVQVADDGTAIAATDPIGEASEVQGEAWITRAGGAKEPLEPGAEIHVGDTIETSANGAVNLTFVDGSTFAVSRDAQLKLNDYAFDAQSEGGETTFSVMKGLFVFTSGMIGRSDPDDVHIETPVGSIGIRGTTIAGDIHGEGADNQITVIDGAIVVRNGLGEITLSEQFETVRVTGFSANLQGVGVMDPADLTRHFEPVRSVVPALFSAVDDAAKFNVPAARQGQVEGEPGEPPAPVEGQKPDGAPENGEGGQHPRMEGQPPMGPDGMTPSPGDRPAGDRSMMGPPTPPEKPMPVMGEFHDDMSSLRMMRMAAMGEQMPEHMKPGMMVPGMDAPPMMGTMMPMGPMMPMLMPMMPGMDPLFSSTQPLVFNPLLPPPPSSGDASGSITALPPLAIGFQPIEPDEDLASTSGLLVGRLDTISGHINVSYHLLGASSDLFYLTQVDANTVEVRMQNNMDLDDIMSMPVYVEAIAGSGQISIRNFTLNIAHTNDAPVFITDGAPMNFFHAASDYSLSGKGLETFKYNFFNEVSDHDLGVEGDTLTFTLASNSQAYLNAVIGAEGTAWGLMSDGRFMLTVPADMATQSFDLDVIVTDAAGATASKIFTFWIKEYAAVKYEGDASSPGILSQNVSQKIFAGEGNDTVSMLHDGVQTWLGLGHDIVNLDASNGTVYGGEGNDTFNFSASTGNAAYGGEGHDRFVLPGGLPGSFLIDGGPDNGNYVHATGDGPGDVLKLDGGLDLDLTLVNDTWIKGIEAIDARLGGANTITLNYTDVLAMTDENNTLRIAMGVGDSLTFDRQGQAFVSKGDVWVNESAVSNDPVHYDVYSNGQVTLLVDHAANVNSQVTVI